MYPTISDLIKDLFGVDIPLPIQSFGFMMAVAFLFAAYTLQLELKRKEKAGLIYSFTKQIVKGKPASAGELISSFLIGFVLGYKLSYAFLNYDLFVQDTQGVLLSLEGNFFGGLLVGGVMAYLQYRDFEKQRLPQPVTETITVHPYELVSNFTIIAAVSGILGAKIFHNLENLHEFEVDPIGALFSFSGLTMYGGLIVATFAVMRYSHKHGIHPMVIADACAPGLMLAYGVGRIGCHISGDGDWGIVNLASKPDFLSWMPDWLWSYNYPNNVIGDGVPIPGCEGRHCMVLPDPVFPTPLYEAIACILLFFVLWRLRKVLVNPGLVFSLYLLLNGVERFAIEQIRVNNKFELAGFILTQAEVIALVLITLGVAGLAYFKNHLIKNERRTIG
jgi:phosphatidylglycerol---prolipoprotein diacylglyceryl transferase